MKQYLLISSLSIHISFCFISKSTQGPANKKQGSNVFEKQLDSRVNCSSTVSKCSHNTMKRTIANFPLNINVFIVLKQYLFVKMESFN